MREEPYFGDGFLSDGFDTDGDDVLHDEEKAALREAIRSVTKVLSPCPREQRASS